MITIYHVDGRVEQVEQEGEPSLAILQRWVGGYIEAVYSRTRDRSGNPTFQLVVNEEGRIRGMEVNERATEVAQLQGMVPQVQTIHGPAVLLSGRHRMT